MLDALVTSSEARDAAGSNKPPAIGFDRPPLVMMRQGRVLAPASDLDAAMLAKYSPSAPIQVRPTQERHGGQHRLYWALLGTVAENLDGDVKADDLHEWVKANIQVVIADHVTGELFTLNAASIAFEVMDQPAFHDFFQRVLTAMVTRIIPGVDRPALTSEAAKLLGFAA